MRPEVRTSGVGLEESGKAPFSGSEAKERSAGLGPHWGPGESGRGVTFEVVTSPSGTESL